MRGLCHLTQIPVRAEARSASEMVTQLIYGECYEVLETEKDWLRIRMDFDGYEGWISEASYHKSDTISRSEIQHELFSVHPIDDTVVITSMGSEHFPGLLDYEEEKLQTVKELALRFLNVPYLWGGRTFTGIDCSGLVQIVFKCLGVALDRDASQQQKQGKAIRFDEIVEGDLVFFDTDYRVTHVGIALRGGRIVHAHGEVRIDELTKQGIFNRDKNSNTHHFHSARRMR